MSLRLTTDHRLLQHILAFTLAWVAASFLFVYLLRAITVEQRKPGYHINTLGKGETAVQNLLYLSAALRGGKTIVVMGSSELDPSFARRNVPYAFFPREHLTRVMSYGRANFDSLGMYGLLFALKPHLNPGSRLVIMLSPAWFKSTDMLPQAFDENFNDNVLLQLYWSDDPRGVFHDYLTAHQHEFSSMTAMQRMFLDNPSSIVDWSLPGLITRTINSRAYAQREKLDLYLEPTDRGGLADVFGARRAADIHWADYTAAARSYELRHMTNNDLWVRDTFFNNVLMRNPQILHRDYFPKNINPEPEMTGLKLLLELLQKSKVKALFVMQPLNPRLYDDIDSFDAVDARITSLCREYGASYLDMYTAPYDPGTLRDGTHLGELGWLTVDQAIVQQYHL